MALFSQSLVCQFLLRVTLCVCAQIIKGIGHVIYANTIFRCELVSRCMPACASPYKPWLCKEDHCPLLIMVQNYNTLYFNNAQLNQTGQKCGCGQKYENTVAGGKSLGVFNGTYQQMVGTIMVNSVCKYSDILGNKKQIHLVKGNPQHTARHNASEHITANQRSLLKLYGLWCWKRFLHNI